MVFIFSNFLLYSKKFKIGDKKQKKNSPNRKKIG